MGLVCARSVLRVKPLVCFETGSVGVEYARQRIVIPAPAVTGQWLTKLDSSPRFHARCSFTGKT